MKIYAKCTAKKCKASIAYSGRDAAMATAIVDDFIAKHKEGESPDHEFHVTIKYGTKPHRSAA